MPSHTGSPIRRAVSDLPEAALAVEAIKTQLMANASDLVLCFAGHNYAPDQLVEAFQKHFPGYPLVACRTAGEITPAGYLDKSLTAVSLPASEFDFEITCLDDLRHTTLMEASQASLQTFKNLKRRLGRDFNSSQCFAMVLIDGLSMREEVVAAGINHGLVGVPLFGGSAADDVEYTNAWLYGDGRLHTDTAILILVHTRRSFEVFKTEHFSSTEEPHITTAVDANERIVWEVDGYPAADWYSDRVGVSKAELSPDVFARHPVTVKSGGKTYVRAIQKIEDDDGIRFYCAIDEGMVLHIGEQGDMLSDLETVLDGLEKSLGGIDLLIGCDCMLRNLEAKQEGLINPLGDLFMRHNAVGFATFGEQLDGIHINQTFTGIAIGRPYE